MSHRLPLYPRLTRVGECSRCGDCCVGDPYVPEATNAPCPHLKPDGEHTACELHGQAGTYWAQGCNVWPSKPEHIAHLARCTFRFEVL